MVHVHPNRDVLNTSVQNMSLHIAAQWDKLGERVMRSLGGRHIPLKPVGFSKMETDDRAID